MIPRPYFHFTPPQNWLNDPNGCVFFNGEYHLFYQYHPESTIWGPMHWGHAVSRDLLHWQHLPIALYPDEMGMIFSGSAVVDWKNTSGFGIGNEPPLVAIYTCHSSTEQTQCIAYSTDNGRTWTKYAGNPVISIGSTEFRDPKVFWHDESHQWIMVTVLSNQYKVRFYGSPNLKQWTPLSDFGPAGDTSGLWECPDLFPLSLQGEAAQQKWVLKVDVQHGIGAQCFIGEFDGQRFVSDIEGRFQRMDCGADFYAAQSWSDVPDGRRIWIGWMNNWRYANLIPTGDWRGLFTIPREVQLVDDVDGFHLIQRPIAEMQRLRSEHCQITESDVPGANQALSQYNFGIAHEIILEFEFDTAARFGIRVRSGNDESTIIGYDAVSQLLFVDRRNSGDHSFSDQFAKVHSTKLTPTQNKIQLHIFIDSCSVEVFADGGRIVFSDCVFPSEHSQGLELFAEGEDVRINSLDVYRLDSAPRTVDEE